MTFFWELVLVAIGTYLLRTSVVFAATTWTMPARFESTLRLIPPAVLSALVANALVFDHGEVRPFGPWYVALGIAGVVAAWTRSVGWTLVVGMVAVWVLTWMW